MVADVQAGVGCTWAGLMWEDEQELQLVLDQVLEMQVGALL